MRLLTATGCRSWSDLAACIACYAIVSGLFGVLCWPAAWS